MFQEEKMLMTGGSGLLGGDVKKLLPGGIYPASAEFNLTDYDQMAAYLENVECTSILHAGAFTSPPKIEEDPIKGIEVNIIGTGNITKLAAKKNIKLIYISTDYVFDGKEGNYKEDDPVSPVNKYAWSKLGGECAVRIYDNSLIIRTSFGPSPFPYEKAFTDQWTSRESAEEIAKKIVALIKKDPTGIYHVGGERKSVFEYANGLRPHKDIGELSIKDVNFNVPKDTSLDCKKYHQLTEQ